MSRGSDRALTWGGALLRQVREVKGQEVVCTALNDALLDGLLTVIHSERGGDGMSSLQARSSMCSRLQACLLLEDKSLRRRGHPLTSLCTLNARLVCRRQTCPC